MKKSLQIFALLFCIIISAQAPEKLSYQAVIGNASGTLITNATVGVKISVLKTSAAGTVVYSESQTPTTNANGLISIQIGSGTVITGTISGIDWSSDSYFIKTETDPAGGTSYSIAGTTQLLSVPYALYAKKSGSDSGFTLPYAGTSSADAIPFKISNTGASINQAGYFENTSLTNTAAAISGKNNSTGGSGIGVLGSANSNPDEIFSAGVNGYVIGAGNGGAGVYGFALNAYGVYGSTDTGTSVRGSSYGTGTAGSFESNNTGTALFTYGSLKLYNIGEGDGKVLASDALGNATWQDLVTPFVHFSSLDGSNQVIPLGITSTINSWTGIEETGGANYNTTTGEYTIPITGYYSIMAQIGYLEKNTVNGDQTALVILINELSRKNAYGNSAVIGQYYSDLSVKLEKKLLKGQKVKIQCLQFGKPSNSLFSRGSTFAINLLHK